MNGDSQGIRKAQIAKLQIALKVIFEALDFLEARNATRKMLDTGSPSDPPDNRFADRIALGMKKTREDEM